VLNERRNIIERDGKMTIIRANVIIQPTVTVAQLHSAYSIFLAIIAILPAFVGAWGVSGTFAQFFGGTSLLIIVGVALDTLQQIESHLLMRHYDGFMKSGKIKGRR